MKKNPAAVALGRRGGKARLTKMTAEQRAEVAKQAAETRWKKRDTPGYDYNRHPGFVYFLMLADESAIKVGWTSNPSNRIRWLRSYARQNFGVDARYIGVMTDSLNEESAIQERLLAYRIDGTFEWFKATPDAIAVVHAYNTRFLSAEEWREEIRESRKPQ